jgi:hypothetical protein
MQIPKSEWILRKEYFKVKLIENFKSEYLQWMNKECGHNIDDLELLRFIDKITASNFVVLYQFPNEDKNNTYDYFEKEDDNHVIPKFLFEMID